MSSFFSKFSFNPFHLNYVNFFPIFSLSMFKPSFPFCFFPLLLSLLPLPSAPFCLFTDDGKSVKAWFDRVAAMHSCQSAVQKVLRGKGLQGMKSYMQKQPAPQSSQCRDTQPCNSSPTEVSARSSG